MTAETLFEWAFTALFCGIVALTLVLMCAVFVDLAGEVRGYIYRKRRLAKFRAGGEQE